MGFIALNHEGMRAKCYKHPECAWDTITLLTTSYLVGIHVVTSLILIHH